MPTETLTVTVSRRDTPYLNNASKILPKSVDVQSEKREAQLKQVVAVFCPFLRSRYSQLEEETVRVEPDRDVTVKPLFGGLSNELFIVENERDKVLVRIHPPSEHAVVDREVENKLVAWLSREGDAPTFYGRFLNGRVEEFYNNVVPLSCQEMVDYGPEIARLFARMHRMKVPTDIFAPTSRGHLWYRVERWLAMTRETRDEPIDPVAESLDGFDLQQELQWLESSLTGDRSAKSAIERDVIDFCKEIVLTHMDCQSLNLLRPSNSYEPNQGKLKWIDFEYAGLNPRAADIANTFCEHCDMNNLKADYEKEYPSDQAQNAFLRAYFDNLDVTPLRMLNAKEQEQFLAAMRQEIGRYTLVSHLGWAIWSVLMSRLSNIDFDYIVYAKHRIDGYKYFKQKYWT